MSYENVNIGNSVFKGFNDKHGLMICGYEWGFSKADQEELNSESYQAPTEEIEHTFANKARHFGDIANKWRYDNTIKKWFELWGFPLNLEELGGDFEKSIVQTNWANTQGHSLSNSDYDKLLQREQVDNFLYHVEAFEPKIIMFMGSKMMDYLQYSDILERFKSIMGNNLEDRYIIQKDSISTKFKVHFQSFEKCEVIGLPHPSGSQGLSHEYIEQFKPEISKILNAYIEERGFESPSK